MNNIDIDRINTIYHKSKSVGLTPEEAEIVRRGRNAHARHGAPRSATPDAYSAATALEALYGYLFLTGQANRLEQLDLIGRGKE